MRVAVIGGGAAGLSAAWMLSRAHETVLFEKADRAGGHAHTIDIEAGGRQLAVDAGFIVFNEANYPNLTRLLRSIGIQTEASDMSFSVSLGGGRIEYAGSPIGLFAQVSNLWRVDHWRMLRDVRRFYASAHLVLTEAGDERISLGEYLDRGGYTRAFTHEHLLPMGAAIWSSTIDDMLAFPARSFIRFFANHGLLRLKNRPQWRTVSGGSRSYVSRLISTGRFELRTGASVQAVDRDVRGVHVCRRPGEWELFDHVVLAVPAPRALALLGRGATGHERRVLGAFRYQPNRAVLHGDMRLLPRRRRVWASWNYLGRAESAGADRVSVSYWMNRLQNLPVAEPIVVSLNPIDDPAPKSVFAELSYEHPQFDQDAIDAQRLIPVLQGVNRTWFCGSYCGFGFHEDAVRSGLGVAAALGSPAPWLRDPGRPGLTWSPADEPRMAAE